QASFGAGIGVGGSQPGAFGPVTVINPTSATAQLSIDPGAVAGPRSVTVRTGVQQAVLANGFSITAAPPPLISAVASPSRNAAGWNNSNVIVTFTCTQTALPVVSCTSPITVVSDGANQAATGTATDSAGRTSTVSVVVNID